MKPDAVSVRLCPTCSSALPQRIGSAQCGRCGQHVSISGVMRADIPMYIIWTIGKPRLFWRWRAGSLQEDQTRFDGGDPSKRSGLA